MPQFPLLHTLQPVEKAQLEAVAQWRSVRKNCLVYQPGDPTDHIYFLVKGAVKTGIVLHDGRTMIRNISLPGQLFGESGLLGESGRRDFARTLNQSADFFAVRVTDFQQLMRHNFELTNAILKLFGDRLRRAELQQQALINKDVRARIVDFIKENAAQRHTERLSLNGLTQADIANLVGASRQTVTAVLNELRKTNVIAFSRRDISIQDRDKLN